MRQIDLAPEWGLDHFDPWDRRIRYDNIWSIYKTMRERAAAHYSEAHSGFWSIVRHQDIKVAARDYRTFSSASGTAIGEHHAKPDRPPKAPIEYDPPEHTRLRKAVQEPFMPRKMEELSSGIRTSVREILDHIAEMGSFDIVTDLAEPVPQHVISKILGFDEETKEKNRELVLRIVNANFAENPQAWKNFHDFLRGEIRKRQADPGDDFLSHLCVDEFEGARFAESEVVSMVAAVALAGHHTAINGISSLLRRVSDDKIRDAYLVDRSLGVKIVEETLRCDPPIHLEARTTTQSVVVEGVKIPANARVALIYASGNHDESVFDHPDEFDMGRDSRQHLSFGHGVHSCFGMHLARLEMNIVLEETLNRFPRYRLNGPQTDTGMVYGHHMGWETIPAFVE